MKIFLPCLLLCLLFFAPSVRATNVVIIESEVGNNAADSMDKVWLGVCVGLGYNAAIYPQTKLDSTNWFCSTDVLIVSSGTDNLSAGRINTIQTYLGQGGRVYLQSEYDCEATPTNAAFEQIVDSLGGSFTWETAYTSDIEPMDVSGVLSEKPNVISPLDYFFAGCSGDGIGANSHITPFLEWDDMYFGFIFDVPNSCGIMITQADEDWVHRETSLPLLQNMLYYLANRTGNCAVTGKPFSVDLGNDTSMCKGDTIVLNAAGNGAVSYLWSNNDTTSFIQATTPGTYWAQVSNSACLLSDSIHITQARTSFQYQLSDSEICAGSSATVSITGASGLAVYPTTGAIWQDSLLASLQPDTNTYYILTGQTTCGNNDTANFLLRVDQPVTINLVADDSSICRGDTAYIQALGNYTWCLWNTGDTTSFIPATIPGVYRINASAGVCTGSDSIEIKQSITDFQYLLSDSEICLGSSATVIISGASGLAVYPSAGAIWQDSLLLSLQPDTNTYYILTGQTTCGNNDTANFLLRVDQPVTINLVADESSICRGDTAYILASGNFTSCHWNTGDSTSWISVYMPGMYRINAIRGACAGDDSIQIKQSITGFQYLLSDSQICARGAATLTITGASDPVFYPNETVNWPDSIHAELQPDSTTSYLLIAQTDCGNYDTASVVLNVFPPVVAQIMPDSAVICSGDSTPICVPGNFVSYSWSSGDSTGCIYARQGSDYYVTVTDSHGCSAESSHVVVSAYPAQSVSIVVDGDTLSTFGYHNYQWYLNDTLIPGASDNVYVADVSGNYIVAIIDSNGCGTVSSPVSVATGVVDLYLDQIEIYPNPSAAGNWQLAVNSELIGSKLEVYDADGRIVFQSEIRDLKSEIPATLPDGVYFLRIYSGEGSVVRKLVKIN